jgi:hypothetical protein
MDIDKFEKVRKELIEDAFEISDEKGEDYRVGDRDALKNFKTVAERTGLRPTQVLGIYMMKHQDAISNYIKSGGQSESEPIKERIIDNINYLCLLWGLIKEKEGSVSNINIDDGNRFIVGK